MLTENYFSAIFTIIHKPNFRSRVKLKFFEENKNVFNRTGF